MKQYAIIDTDPGIDDLQAILIPLHNKNIEVIGYTICNGNTSIDQATDNLNKFLYYVGERNYTIFKGYNDPSVDFPESDDYFKINGNCGLNFPDAPEKHIQKKPAYIAIAQLANYYSPNLIIICMGPVTNLAQAYEYDNSINNKFKHIYIMGGSRFHEVEENKTKYAEFNAHFDPKSYDIVFKNFEPIKSPGFTLIDWHFCYTYDMSKDLLNKLGNIENDPDNPKKLFYHQLLTNNVCNHIFDNEKYIIADQYVMCVAYYPEIITKYKLVTYDSIVFDGEEQGKTTFIEKENSNIILVDEIDLAEFELIMQNSVKISENISDN